MMGFYVVGEEVPFSSAATEYWQLNNLQVLKEHCVPNSHSTATVAGDYDHMKEIRITA
jgi:hypothetical protein